MEETVEKLEAWTKAGGSVLFYRTGLADEYRSGGDRAGGDKAGGDRSGENRSDRNWPGGDRANGCRVNGCSVNGYWNTVLREKCTQHQPYSGSSSCTGCAVRIRDLRKSRRHLFES